MYWPPPKVIPLMGPLMPWPSSDPCAPPTTPWHGPVVAALQFTNCRMYPGCTVYWKKVWAVSWVLITTDQEVDTLALLFILPIRNIDISALSSVIKSERANRAAGLMFGSGGVCECKCVVVNRREVMIAQLLVFTVPAMNKITHLHAAGLLDCAGFTRVIKSATRVPPWYITRRFLGSR